MKTPCFIPLLHFENEGLSYVSFILSSKEWAQIFNIIHSYSIQYKLKTHKGPNHISARDQSISTDSKEIGTENQYIFSLTNSLSIPIHWNMKKMDEMKFGGRFR